ncbi:hypothetical protein SKAU_G00247510 [Synaphobranchus kaupii]|uniref:Uncharacterized protein n=1 Tax=Synaphobranchus kaupii TaxID=118154 RepID=A0A9Q1F299_SYNKA|nr:hypothetical protein SKAU_G00247510 [Synaphobranchus kaupii]
MAAGRRGRGQERQRERRGPFNRSPPGRASLFGGLAPDLSPLSDALATVTAKRAGRPQRAKRPRAANHTRLRDERTSAIQSAADLSRRKQCRHRHIPSCGRKQQGFQAYLWSKLSPAAELAARRYAARRLTWYTAVAILALSQLYPRIPSWASVAPGTVFRRRSAENNRDRLSHRAHAESHEQNSEGNPGNGAAARWSVAEMDSERPRAPSDRPPPHRRVTASPYARRHGFINGEPRSLAKEQSFQIAHLSSR